MKRKPDIKWQRKKEDIEEITKIQLKILENSANYLKIGGELVYSTCSILKNENEDIIKEWMDIIKTQQHKIKMQYEIKDKKKILPNKNTDGFFICKIKRIS